MNLNIGDVTKSIGANQIIVENNLNDLRELLKQLKQTENNRNINKPIQQEISIQEEIPVEETNLENTEEDYMLEGEGIDTNAGVVNDLKLEIPKSDNFDSSKPYTRDNIKLYHDVASNLTTSKSMSIEQKYNIIKNAEKRREYLINIKETNSNEFKKLNEMYETCKNNNYCQGIINEWKDIELRRPSPPGSPRNDNISSRENSSRPNSSRPNSSRSSSPRPNSSRNEGFVQTQIQNIEGRKNNRLLLPPINTTKKLGGKRRSTMKRGKQNKKSQKKSKSHKKRH
jgi:hypothetical protein